MREAYEVEYASGYREVVSATSLNQVKVYADLQSSIDGVKVAGIRQLPAIVVLSEDEGNSD